MYRFKINVPYVGKHAIFGQMCCFGLMCPLIIVSFLDDCHRINLPFLGDGPIFGLIVESNLGNNLPFWDECAILG